MSRRARKATPTGDCFRVACRAALALPGRAEARICHGLPIGQGPANSGRRFWHAWVEYEADDGTAMALDPSRPGQEPIQIPRDAYYAIGQIDPAAVFRFSSADARVQMRVRGHWGPWVSAELFESAL